MWQTPILLTLTMAHISLVVPSALLAPKRVGRSTEARAEQKRLSTAEWNALERGTVVTGETRDQNDNKSDQRSVHAAALIAQPPELVWQVLTDFEKRPQFLPGAKEIRVVRVDGNRVWLDEYVKVLLVSIHYRVINILEPEQGVMKWVLDKESPHDIADTEGAWGVVAVDQGKRTLVTYRAWIDTGQPVPGFLESFLMKRSLPELIEGLRAEVERRAVR